MATSTPSRVTRSRKVEDHEVSTPGPAQTTSKTKLGKSDASRRLRCLIEGEPPIFQVALPKDKDIGDLKELVYEKGINTAKRSILAKDLVLLKVDIDLESHDDDSLGELAFDKDDEGVEKLKDWKLVSNFWPVQPAINRLHVFVKLPVSDQHDSKRRRFSGPEVSDDHIRFWKRLWVDKVDPIQEVAVNRGPDPVEDIIVPPTMKVLHGFPEIFALNDVLVREEYKKAFEIIEKYLATHRAIIIVGHPGIGKTILLYYILAFRLFSQQPTIFQYRPDVILLFDASGVSQLSPSSEFVYSKATDVWALVDSNESVPTPAATLIRATSPFPLIIASSPRASRWQDVEHYRPPIAYWFMEPFTLVELFQARQLQAFNLKESDVQDFFETYGPSARDCYAYCSDTKSYLSLILSKVADMTWDTITKALTRGRDGLTLEEGSHKVILVDPQPENNALPRIRIVTKAVSQLLWEQDTNARGRNHRQLFRTLCLEPSAKSFTGRIFEPPFHELCVRGTRFTVYPMVKQSSGPINHIYVNYPAKSPEYLVLNTQTPLVFNRTQPITSLLADHYYWPSSSTQPSYDSFIYAPNLCQIDAFQVTDGDNHDLKPKGIHSLFALAKELNVNNLKLRFIIVVPEGSQVKCPVEKTLIDLGMEMYTLEVTENELYGD